MDVPGTDRLNAVRESQGPLDAPTARALLDRGWQRLEAGEPLEALADFRRVSGHDDANLTAEAMLGAGDALYRLDAEDAALASWESVVRLPETASTYRAWRQIAGARVRSGDLGGASKAYQEADRRAPAEDRREIASRLGWLAKESGNAGAAGRYFARSRGTGLPIGVALAVLGVTVAISLAATFQESTGLFELLALERRAVLDGELYRLLSVTLVHGGLAHLFFNMYALYLIGPIVENIWGSRLFAAFYVLTAIAASTASILLNPGPAVGASGAVFGLVGVLLAGTRAHHPVLDQRARSIVPQLGMIVLINLAFGFLAGGTIDNAAHVGGLLAGMWLGVVVPPGKVPTLRSAWQHPAGQAAMRSPMLITAGVVLLVAVIALGLALVGAGVHF